MLTVTTPFAPFIKGEFGTNLSEELCYNLCEGLKKSKMTNFRQHTKVRIWEETVTIPTYRIGKPEKNPMFFEKRVYQGSSGKVYPYPFYEKVFDEKYDEQYRVVFLENEFIKLMVMPSFGGRIQYAYDKTNDYAFIYHNHVIKPALVGLTGPWLSGGIEFNWPQHHRPGTFLPVDYKLVENADGSKSVLLGEVERMSGLKEFHAITLHPGKAYIEISVQVYNGTPLPQTFLWWANPAVSVNDDYQSVFPQDVHFVADHGKRDISRFPIATGTYYEMDYSEGVDISWYKNIPVPSSYMVLNSKYDFVGGYDHGKEAGLLHVANHHVSPGKKQWTWGNGEFAKAWELNLTDDDGPYVELMTGVYTDNQPDFCWLHPYETKSFTQYFYPYQKLGRVKNATCEAAVNLELEDDSAIIKVHTTEVFEGLEVVLKYDKLVLSDEIISVGPGDPHITKVKLVQDADEVKLKLSLITKEGRELVSWSPESEEEQEFPDPAQAALPPEEIESTDKLYQTGLHLEQYRHATFDPDPYYLEAMKRNPSDVDNNNAYGLLLLRRGDIRGSEKYFRRGVETLIERNPNPYKSEPYYNLGLSLFMQGRYDEAYDLFYKCTWNDRWKSVSFFYIARIDCIRKDYAGALKHINESLKSNTQNNHARNLKAAILRKEERVANAKEVAIQALTDDPLNYGAMYEYRLSLELTGRKKEAKRLLQYLKTCLARDSTNYLVLAEEYLDAAFFDEASNILQLAIDSGIYSNDPMIYYYMAYCAKYMGHMEYAISLSKKAAELPADYCFPNRLKSVEIINLVQELNPEDSKASYYLGNLLYDKKRYDDAIESWEKSRCLDNTFPTVHRNLAIAYYNKKGDLQKAQEALEAAFALDPDDARVFFELDQLYKKRGKSPEERLRNLNDHRSLAEQRDDVYMELVMLCNLQGNYSKAAELLADRRFHPWEGGEGKVTGQYVLAHVQLGRTYLDNGDYERAIEELMKAQTYPENLGEGKLTGARENNIHYYLACAYEELGDKDLAKDHLDMAADGDYSPSMSMYYYDKASDMIFYQGLALSKLGRGKEARSKFHKLVDYGQAHLFDDVKIDYFAISLPDFLVFDEDLDTKNKVNCLYLMGLGYLGLGETEKAKEKFLKVLELDVNHIQSKIFLSWIDRSAKKEGVLVL